MSEERRNDSPANGAKPPKSKRGKKPKPESAKAGDVGRALRTVYDTTLREDVPSDFLDLLGKLN